MPALSAITTRSGRGENPVWPLAVPFIGLPLWWLLGVWQIILFAMAIPMLYYLLRQRTVEMPRGFWVWLLWLAWLLTGLLVLQVDAPGTVGGVSMNRYLTFGLRYAWYLTATIVALYVLNTRRVLSTQKIVQAVAWFFVCLVVGGLLGLIAPNISFPSLFQMALPHGLASNSLVNELTHVQTAQIHTIVGAPQPRPSAPFIYTNSWGFTLAMTLPLFVVAWWSRTKPWRIAAVGVLILAMIPVIVSLNRGTWVAILAAVALTVVQLALRGHVKILAIAAIVGSLAAVLLITSPAGDLILARLENGHSDSGRENLAMTAVASTAQGSPIVGFGSTRDVAGNFSSIAGGASAACPNCEPPPVGTHGQLWMAIFGAGFVGMVLYVGFLLSQFLRNWRTGSPYSLAALSCVLIMLVTLPFYNVIGIPMYIGFIAIGLLARESQPPLPTLQGAILPIKRHAPALAGFVIVGALAGFGVHAALGTPVTATQRVLVPSAELVSVPGVRTSTIDAEALIATSDEVAQAVAVAVGSSVGEAMEALTIGAETNTRVMLIRYRGDSPELARLGVETAVAAYLDQRAHLLSGVTSDVRARYALRQGQLDEIYRDTRPIAAAAQSSQLWGTVSRINQDWAKTSEILIATESAAQARAISDVRLRASNTERTVRVSSAAALGGLIGLPVMLYFDARRLRLGARPRRSAGITVPVVARLRATDVQGAMSVVGAYSPLAGLVADADSGPARRLAAGVDEARGASPFFGSRVIVVVDALSQAGKVRSLLERLGNAGLDPVGLVYAEQPVGQRPGRHTGRGVRRRTGVGAHE